MEFITSLASAMQVNLLAAVSSQQLVLLALQSVFRNHLRDFDRLLSQIHCHHCHSIRINHLIIFFINLNGFVLLKFTLIFKFQRFLNLLPQIFFQLPVFLRLVILSLLTSLVIKVKFFLFKILTNCLIAVISVVYYYSIVAPLDALHILKCLLCDQHQNCLGIHKLT